MTETALDIAHAAMEAAPDSDAARLGFYARLADSELVLLLEEEAEGDTLSPQVFELEEGRFVLGFDSEERLAGFTGRASAYAALPGRVVAQVLAEQGLGLGLNLEVAPSAMLIPAEALAWLVETTAQAPEAGEGRIRAVHAPRGLPEPLLAALDAKLARAGGLARAAYLAAVEHEDGGRGHLLAFIDAVPGAEPALARAAGEALTFSGIEAGALDVAFFAGPDRMAARLERNGLRIDLPAPEPAEPHAPSAPGSDPARPPILR